MCNAIWRKYQISPTKHFHYSIAPFDFFPATAAGRRKVNRRLMDLTHGSKEGTALGREMDMLSG